LELREYSVLEEKQLED
jgi:hypothetical protein